MSRRTGVLVLLAASLLLAPGAVRPVAAAWGDREYARLPATLASSDCTETGLYTASASAALLAGSVPGAAIDGALAPVATGARTDGSTTSRAVTAAAITTASLPLVPTSGGSWAQTATTSGTGSSSAAAGGSAALGAIDVYSVLGRAPSATALLPGITGLRLDVGAPTAAASFDGCAAGWGGARTPARTSSLGVLGLRLQDASLAAATGSMQTRATSAATGIGTLATAAAQPVASAAASALAAALAQALTVGTAGPATGTASVTATTAPIGVAAAAARTVAPATLDPTTGTATVDLLPAVAAGGGVDVGLVTASGVAAASTAIGQALSLQATSITSATTTAREGATVAVAASADVLVAGAAAATVTVTASGTAAAWAAHAVTPVVTIRALSIATLQTDLVGAVTRALGSLPVVCDAVAAGYLTPARNAAPDGALAADAAGATTALAADLAALPSVLAVTAGQRATSAAASWTGALPDGVWTQSALRVRVKDGGGTRCDLFVGNVAVGPDLPALR